MTSADSVRSRVAERPGRSCPLAYRYAPAALARDADVAAETLYVVGGLYGNPFALESVLELARGEPAPVTIVFNGDFNWFNVDQATFDTVNEEVLKHRALRGNVETEIANDTGGADCGCGYPDSVSDAEVARSNEIIVRLRDAARSRPDVRGALGRLPMHLVASVGGARVGIVHGDAESLAGWSYSPEALAEPAGIERVRGHFDAANLDVIASTHTCRAIAVALRAGGRMRALFNNGAAGMPNFRGQRCGLLTRISVRPAPEPLYGTQVGPVYVDAVPVRYDHGLWLDAFLANWPEGSAGHASYFDRIRRGLEYDVSAAALI